MGMGRGRELITGRDFLLPAWRDYNRGAYKRNFTLFL